MEKTYISGQEITTTAANLPFITHKGIILNKNGNTFIIHNTLKKNVNIEHIESFTSARKVLSIIDTPLVGLTLNELLEKYHNLKHKSFRLITYNCEHFVKEMQNAPIKSKSIENFKKIAIAVVLLHFFTDIFTEQV